LLNPPLLKFYTLSVTDTFFKGKVTSMFRNITMTPLDDETKAELLTFLVVGHLLALARAGDWLRTGHLIESAQLWLKSNGAQCDWLDRARLVEASREVAKQACKLPYPKDESGLIKLFNLQAGWFLDYRSPVVQKIHVLSVEYLSASTPSLD
jgi:hypothetical protein